MTFIKHFERENELTNGKFDIYSESVHHLLHVLSDQGHSGSTALILIGRLKALLLEPYAESRRITVEQLEQARAGLWVEFHSTLDPFDMNVPVDMDEDEYRYELYRVAVACFNLEPLSIVTGAESEWSEWFDGGEDRWRMNIRSYQIVQRGDRYFYTDGIVLMGLTDDASGWVSSTSNQHRMEVTLPIDRLPKPIYRVRDPENRDEFLRDIDTSIEDPQPILKAIRQPYYDRYLRGFNIDGEFRFTRPSHQFLNILDLQEIITYFEDTLVYQIPDTLDGINELINSHPTYLRGSYLNPMLPYQTDLLLRMLATMQDHVDPDKYTTMGSKSYDLRPILKPSNHFQSWVPVLPSTNSGNITADTVLGEGPDYYNIQLRPIYLDQEGRELDITSESEARKYLYDQCKSHRLMFHASKTGKIYQAVEGRSDTFFAQWTYNVLRAINGVCLAIDTVTTASQVDLRGTEYGREIVARSGVTFRTADGNGRS